MQRKILTTLLAGLISLTSACHERNDLGEQMSITNPKLKGHEFLKAMKEDSYFPGFLVEKGVNILKELCIQIETTSPKTDEEIYKLTHSATEKFNELQEEFDDNESEIETAAREAIAEDFEIIVSAYGFDLDIEEVIAPRDW